MEKIVEAQYEQEEIIAVEANSTTIVDAPKEVENIKEEILSLKEKAEFTFLEMGRLLIDLKDKIPYGEWKLWIAENLEFSQRTAQCYMQLHKAFQETQSIAHLGFAKASLIVRLPESEREEFISTPHLVQSSTYKEVSDMSRRELEGVLRDRKRSGKPRRGAVSCKNNQRQSYPVVNEEAVNNSTDNDTDFSTNLEYIRSCLNALIYNLDTSENGNELRNKQASELIELLEKSLENLKNGVA